MVTCSASFRFLCLLWSRNVFQTEAPSSLIEALSVADLPELLDRDIGDTLAKVTEASLGS